VSLEEEITQVLRNPAATTTPFKDRLRAITRASFDQAKSIEPARSVVMGKRCRSRNPPRMVVRAGPIPPFLTVCKTSMGRLVCCHWLSPREALTIGHWRGEGHESLSKCINLEIAI
jgi:hypothetical protein